MRQDIILEIEGLRKSFITNRVGHDGRSEDERFYVIDDLDIRIPKGKTTALIGGNGAGKTTLFNLISGFSPADGGKILYRTDGRVENLLKYKAHRISRMGVGRMFQDNHVLQSMTILENMLIADSDVFDENPFLFPFKLAAARRTEKQRKIKAQRIFCDLFGMNNPFWSDRFSRAGSLSYGQQRLLGLSRLLMGNYQLLLLDEPTSGVNPLVIKQIEVIIASFVKERGLSVFLIEHNMKVVSELADFCIFMSHGRIAAFGEPEEIIGNLDVRRTYLGV